MTETNQLPEKYLNRAKRLNPEYIALWESYLDEGMPILYVAEMFGVDEETVARHYPGRGWTHAQVSAHGTFMKHHNEKMRKRY